MPGCCAVGSAPALGAGGREFESRHSDLLMHADSLRIGVLFCFVVEFDERFLKECKKCATKSGMICIRFSGHQFKNE